MQNNENPTKSSKEIFSEINMKIDLAVDADSNPANDDDIFAANLIEEIKKTSGNSSYIFAFLLSISWILVSVLFVYNKFESQILEIKSIDIIFTNPSLLGYIFYLAIPLPIIWTLASLIKRIKELRVMSNALLKTSLKLTQPDKLSHNAIMSLGKSIENEVSSMSTGIENTIKRAQDLEKIVSSEVSMIENAYNENERKMIEIFNLIKKEKDEIKILSNNIKIELEPILSNFKDDTKNLDELIISSINKLSDIERSVKNKTDLIEISIDKMNETVNSVNEVSDSISYNSNEAYEKLKIQSEILTENSDKLVIELDAMTAQFNQQNLGLGISQKNIKDTRDSINTLITNSDDTLSKFSNILDQKVDKMNSSISNLEQKAIQASQEIDNKITESTEMSSTTINTALESIEKKSDIIANTIKNISHETSELMQVQSEEFQIMMDKKLSEINNTSFLIINSIKDANKDNSVELNKTVSDISDRILNATHEANKLAVTTLELEMSKTIVKADKVALDLSQAAKETSRVTIKELTDSMNAALLVANDINFLIENTSEKSVGKIINSLNIAIESAENNALNLSESLSKKIHNTNREITDQLNLMIDQAGTKVTKITETIIKNSDEANEIALFNLENISINAKEKLNEAKDSSASIANNILNKISGLANNVNNELNNLHARTIKEVHANINEAETLYSENAQEMRLVSKEIARELEETRLSMKKAIIELPEETKKYMESMRTVVGEQITALSRLNSLISKYDESNDVLKPEKIIDNTKVIVNNKYSKDEVNENEINYKSYNWILPELLAPTSRNNEKKLTFTDSKIQDLEIEICKLIKIKSSDMSDAIVSNFPNKLWENYYNGEEDIFNEGIYTKKGKRIYLNVRGKYIENRSFRNLLNKYIRDFDILLKKISNDDENENNINAYLDSEMGRIYLLLSHATGKLD